MFESKMDLEKTGGRAQLPEDSVAWGKSGPAHLNQEDKSVFRKCQD